LNGLGNLIKWLRSPGPHYRKIEELARVASPDGKRAAVLIRAGGRTAALRVVPSGKAVYGYDNLAVLIHCGEMVMDWEGDTIIIKGECQEFTAKVEVEEAPRSYTLII
jgi:hypothetical protein